jgi:hypothetical protein
LEVKPAPKVLKNPQKRFLPIHQAQVEETERDNFFVPKIPTFAAKNPVLIIDLSW